MELYVPLAQLLLAFGGSPCEQGIDGAELCSSGVSECLAGLQHEQFVFHLSFTLKTKMMIMIIVSVSDLHELLNFLEKEGSCIVVLMEKWACMEEVCQNNSGHSFGFPIPGGAQGRALGSLI